MNNTLSRFIEYNGTGKAQLDTDGKLLDGTVISEDKKTILRFRSGLLDGDIYNTKGKLLLSKPAVETEGHQEYWREGKLHRDNGLPAVISDGFRHKEWWENGTRIEK